MISEVILKVMPCTLGHPRDGGQVSHFLKTYAMSGKRVVRSRPTTRIGNEQGL